MSSDNQTNIYCGLRNYGNTCYINAVLQCLNSTVSILQGLTDRGEHIKDIETYKLIEKHSDDELDNVPELKEAGLTIDKIKNINIYYNFKKLLIELNKYEDKTLEPLNFIMASKSVADNNGFDNLFSGMQNDAQEFYTFLLDILHESKTSDEEIPTKFGSLEECGASSANKIYYKAEAEFKRFYNKKSSWLIKEFYFQIICITKCNKCDYYSLNYDPSNSLIVPIPSLTNKNQNLTLIDCLDHHFGKEIFGDESQWKCDGCQNKEKNYKQYRMFNAPKTLTINIKRFEYNPRVRDYVKNNKMIEVPEILDMSNYKLFDKNIKNIYRLYGVVNHIGNIDSGHYYSFCRNNIRKNASNDWFVYNDENISKLQDDLITPRVYMLFYQLVE